MIYLYPDLLHGIKGHFNSNGLLLSGFKGQVSGLFDNNKNEIKKIRFDIGKLNLSHFIFNIQINVFTFP